ncbi:serine hydrolase domain-containing protein [Paenibacillus agilis]|uniref:Beta-lactamase family protein n=1 Tax=Paenibacillus agilis TaxID=3020863 RepID=A0A559J2P7_9BACL|nr:serine hydrolase domain-containing protein [Paenibacillus agilis]TVX94143.1 beta-lactamase family protein [Paenibacillus agilis]
MMNVKKTILMSLAVMMAGNIMLITGDGSSTASAQASKAPLVASVTMPDASQQQQRIQQALDQFVAKGIPGVILQTVKDGVKQDYVAGKASIYAERKMQPDFHFRIGSITKTFTATVILQLVGEGKLSLDDSVEKWLPGVVQGKGYDSSKITIRMLLNMRSGIPDFASGKLSSQIFENRFKNYTAEELVKVGVEGGPLFAPGSKFDYSSTNTVLAGLIIQKVTGQTYAEQIKKRIIEPLKLNNTSVAGSITKLPEPHARGYVIKTIGGPLEDFTEINISWGHAAGDMISTTADINRFFSELLAGNLLKPEQMKEMFTAELVDGEVGYGLGISERKTANGVSIWGHTGGTPGYISFAGGTVGGKHVITYNYTLHPGPDLDKTKAAAEMQKTVLEAEFGQSAQ